MHRFTLAIVLVAACQAHDPALEHKVDTLATQIAAMQHDVAELRAAVERPPPPNDLDAKIADLQRKLDAIARMPPPPMRPKRREPDPDKVYALAVDGYASEGPADAAVTMVLAFDYADPFTERTRDGRAEMRKKYGNDLRIVYRNFVVHPQVATAGALAGCAASKQHKFTAFDAIAWTNGFAAHNFDQDKCWETDAGCPIVLGFAKQAGVTDLAKLKHDMKACEAELRADMREMQELGIGATPSFFINGRYFVGAQPTESFEALVDAELARANERIRAGASAATYYKDWVLAKGQTRLDP